MVGECLPHRGFPITTGKIPQLKHCSAPREGCETALNLFASSGTKSTDHSVKRARNGAVCLFSNPCWGFDDSYLWQGSCFGHSHLKIPPSWHNHRVCYALDMRELKRGRVPQAAVPKHPGEGTPGGGARPPNLETKYMAARMLDAKANRGAPDAHFLSEMEPHSEPLRISVDGPISAVLGRRKVPMGSRIAFRIGALLCAGLTCIQVQAQAPSPQAVKIDRYMRASAKLGQFSGAVLVARSGKVVLSRGYGMADAEWSIPNGPATKYRIGSITKQFTAMAVMILQERGALTVSDPICNYIANCPVAWRPIALHHLLSHTSGIPDYLALPDYDKTKSQPTTVNGLIARFKGQPLNFAPGEKFEYSNSGYVLLGAVIEKASGEPYDEFLRHSIFKPLGMSSTGYDSNAAVLPGRASGYTKPRDTLMNAEFIDMSVPYAAGGLYSTTSDLLLWDKALGTNKLVSRKSLQAIFTPDKDMVGYGWAIGSLFNRRMVHHNGGIDGFTSNIARFPDDKVLIVVLSNLEQSPVDAITKDLAAIVFGEKYAMPTALKIVKLDPATYGSYVGKYVITADISLTVTHDGDHLMAKLSGGDDAFEVFPESETKFFSKDPPVELVFARSASGGFDTVSVNGQYTGKRVP